MIDAEVKIFNRMHEKIAPLCATNRFVSTPIHDYAKTPAASLYELDNSTYRRTQTSTPIENFALLTYQFEAVANTKAKCREMYGVADDVMLSLNFSRMSGQYITYPDNPKIVRYVARYEALIDREGNIYRRS